MQTQSVGRKILPQRLRLASNSKPALWASPSTPPQVQVANYASVLRLADYVHGDHFLVPAALVSLSVAPTFSVGVHTKSVLWQVADGA
jgi:hypothetical protein